MVAGDSNMAYLQVNGITKSFGGLVAVDHVSFEVEEGGYIIRKGIGINKADHRGIKCTCKSCNKC